MPEPINGEFYTAEDDVLMMQTPGEWPQWPLLPVKRTTPKYSHQAGVMVETEAGVLPVVYHHNLWSGPNGLAEAERFEYDSFQAVSDDGWKVD